MWRNIINGRIFGEENRARIAIPRVLCAWLTVTTNDVIFKTPITVRWKYTGMHQTGQTWWHQCSLIIKLWSTSLHEEVVFVTRAQVSSRPTHFALHTCWPLSLFALFRHELCIIVITVMIAIHVMALLFFFFAMPYGVEHPLFNCILFLYPLFSPYLVFLSSAY